jgi:DNA-binding NarL/FixJ family response regulator
VSVTAARSLEHVVGEPTARRVRELRRELRTVGDDEREGAFFETFLPAFRELLGTQAVSAYGLRQSATTAHELSFHEHDGAVLDPEFSPLFSRLLVRSGDVAWGAYNPGRPEPRQRNRVVSLSWAEMVEQKNLRIATELFPRIGVGGMTQVRVLVCDGPSLLGWVGTWQDGDGDERQRAIFTALIPELRRRLVMDRQLAQSARLAAFDAVLDAIGKAAFLVDGHGRIREANRLGRELVRKESRALRDELVAAVASAAAPPRWTTTAVRSGASVGFLLVERSPSAGARLDTQVALAATRWSLTPRQTEILARVAEGNANRTIAAIAGISERTVEVHVTALLDKAQVECRAELVARVYGLE